MRTQHVLIATVYDEKGKPRRNRALMTMVATFLGITALPLAQQLPNVFDIGM